MRKHAWQLTHKDIVVHRDKRYELLDVANRGNTWLVLLRNGPTLVYGYTDTLFVVPRSSAELTRCLMEIAVWL